MKITLRLRLASRELMERLAADPMLSKAMGMKPNGHLGPLSTKFFDADGPVLDRLLPMAQEALSFFAWPEYTRAELDAATHLEASAKVTIGQTEADRKATLAAYESEPLVPTASPWPVRLPQRLYLSKPVPPHTIAYVDQWTGEYVLSHDAAQALQASGFTGFALRPVLHWKTHAPRAEVGWHLATDALLPAALRDATTRATHDDGPHEPSTPRRYGALTYAMGVLADSPDLARTAEPWDAWCTPAWVVRQRVREWFTRQGLRGWRFEPVLEEGRALHREHLERWARVLGRLQEAGAEVSI